MYGEDAEFERFLEGLFDGGYGWASSLPPAGSGLYHEANIRNAGAIRTAIMLGAEFEQLKNGQWSEKTINSTYYSRSVLAFIFIGRHGLWIDDNGSPHPYSYFQEKLNVPHSSG